jgi:hypothetical protein
VDGVTEQTLFMSYVRFVVLIVCVCGMVSSVAAEEAGKPKQFIYVLRLVPRLHSDSAWTKEDNMAISRHFARFQHAIETGELILAG